MKRLHFLIIVGLILCCASLSAMNGPSQIIYQNIETQNNNSNEVITNSVSERPFVETKTTLELSGTHETYLVKQSGVKITKTDKGFEKIEDFDNGTITALYQGQVLQPFIDNPDNPDETEVPTRSTEAEVLFVFDRFDVYIDSAYFYNNETDLIQYLDDFKPRFDTLESRTGWTSEQFTGLKLKITILPYSSCRFGYALPSDATVLLHDPFSDVSSCNRPFAYFHVIVHESTHGISPIPIYSRTWLAESWTTYEQFNTLVAFGDIPQNYADGEIYWGSTGFNWLGYVANDYLDNSGYDLDIQSSAGYYITAWMFTMMRDSISMALQDVYDVINENHGTLNKGESMMDSSHYFTDMAVINMFGRGAGLDFAAIKNIWQYDGPSGPGWGVRNWVSRDWYGDVTPTLSYSEAVGLEPAINILTTIHNLGEVNYISMPINIYHGTTLIDSLRIDVPALDSVVIATLFNQPAGDYTIRAVVDIEDLKIEKDETNNEVTELISLIDFDNDNFYDLVDCDDNDASIYPGAVEILDDDIDQDCDGIDATCCIDQTGDINNDSEPQPDISDLLFLVDYMFLPPGSAPEPACMKEADVNGDGSPTPDISDLLYLVDYMFLPPGTAPEPVGCP